MTYYQRKHYLIRHNPVNGRWEGWRLAYPTQPLREGKKIVTARLRHHMWRMIMQKENK